MERLTLEMIHRRITAAQDVLELRKIRDQIHEGLQRHLLFMDPLDWNRDLNEFHDRLIRRSIELSEQELNGKRDGKAPVSFAFLLFGSAGRGEQTLWSDQDNGLIYVDPENERLQADVESYFSDLADIISRNLEEIGYPPCSGSVICTNRMWRKPQYEFQQSLQNWMEDPNWESIRYLLIAADLRTIYGDKSFGEALIKTLCDYVADHPEMLEHMLKNTLHHQVSIGLFGQLIKERYGEDAGGVEVKYGVYIPIVNGVRLLAVEAGICVSSTEERIQKLISCGFVEEEIGQDWLEALSLAIKLRSLAPYQIENGHYTTRGKLKAEQLTRERITELKLCLRIGKDLQRYVKRAFEKG